MSGARFVRFYPSDWRSGCIGMSFEQEGFYIRVCAFICESNRRLPLDDSTAAKLIGANTNAYRKLRDQLVALGKVKRCENGYTVPRAEKELAAATYSKGQQERQANQDAQRETVPDTVGGAPQDARGDAPLDTPLEFSKNINEINAPLKSLKPIAIKKEKDPLPPRGGPTPLDALRAFEAYNATALRCGLPQAAKLTPDRSRKIVARLKDYGLDGWSQALANIEKSSFLTGKNDRAWSANLEFLLQPASFAKVHDGGYGNGRHAASKFAPVKRDDPRRYEDSDYLEQVARELGVA